MKGWSKGISDTIGTFLKSSVSNILWFAHRNWSYLLFVWMHGQKSVEVEICSYLDFIRLSLQDRILMNEIYQQWILLILSLNVLTKWNVLSITRFSWIVQKIWALHFIPNFIWSVTNKRGLTRGPRYYLDTSAFDIFGKSVPMRNLKKWY